MSPSLRRRLGWSALVLAAWTGFGLLTAAQAQLLAAARGTPRPLSAMLFGPAMVGAWIWAAYTPVIVAAARRIRRLRESRGAARGWARYVVAHLLTATAIIAIDVPLWAAIRPLIDGVVLPLDRIFASTLLLNVFGYLSVVTLTEAADYAARWRERERTADALARTAATLREKLDEERLRALEMQLQPHFLYNTLNLIAELVHHDPEGADRMLTNLGALLRRAYRDGEHHIPLAEEIDFVRAYGEILTYRYRDRVTLSLRVPAELGDCAVPAFLLQPLVENAFRHGVEPREGASEVDVVARRDGTSLVIQIGDRAVGRHRELGADGSASAPATHGVGIGLRNTRERLALLYGAEGSLALVRSPRETVATVRLPIALDRWPTVESRPQSARAVRLP